MAYLVAHIVPLLMSFDLSLDLVEKAVSHLEFFDCVVALIPLRRVFHKSLQVIFGGKGNVYQTSGE